MSRDRRVPILLKAMDVLEAIADAPDGLTLSEVCQSLGFPKTTVHSILRTLASRQYLIKDPQNRRYRLGGMLAILGRSVQVPRDINNLLDLVEDELRQECNETINLAILDGTNVVYLDTRESTQAVRMVSPVALRLPAHATALGKALLSCLSNDEVRARLGSGNLPKLTPKTVSSVEDLIQELELVRTQGFAIDDGGYTEGVSCVASPIFDREGKAIAAISISAPSFRMRGDELSRMARLVKKSAAKLSRYMGFVGLNTRET